MAASGPCLSLTTTRRLSRHRRRRRRLRRQLGGVESATTCRRDS
ncbi:hypothetical protein ACP4OV_005779 [Aristida adscensionis]